MITLEPITANILRLVVPETVQAEDFAQLEPQIDAAIKQHGSLRLLVDASHFNGWANMAAFSRHMAFVRARQRYAERVALIAKHAWQYWLVGIISLFVHPVVHIYYKSQESEALLWIKS